MTATQTLKIYQVLNKHFKNSEDDEVLVSEIKSIVDNKIDQRKEVLATKEDILNLKVEIERRFNQIIIGVVSTGIAVVGLLLAFLKL